MATHRVYIDKGDQVLVTVPHRNGQPVRVASATYEIVDTRYGIDSGQHVVVAAGTPATIDTTATTLTNKAGRNASDRRSLTLLDTGTLIAGHVYWLEAANGQAELVTVERVASGTVARTESEIRGDYPTGSSLRGIEVAATFPASEANDDDNLDGTPFLLVWSFPGLPPVRESIHAERGEEMQLATIADLVQIDPMIPLVGGNRINPTTALARAHRDLRVDLQIAGIRESDLLAGPIGRDAVAYRAAYLCMSHAEDPASQEKAKGYLQRYQTLSAALISGDKTKQQVAALTADQAASPFNPAKIWRIFGA